MWDNKIMPVNDILKNRTNWIIKVHNILKKSLVFSKKIDILCNEANSIGV